MELWGYACVHTAVDIQPRWDKVAESFDIQKSGSPTGACLGGCRSSEHAANLVFLSWAWET
jgi:hypothetical protein